MKTKKLKTYRVTDLQDCTTVYCLGESSDKLTHQILFGQPKLLYGGKPWNPIPEFWEVEELKNESREI